MSEKKSGATSLVELLPPGAVKLLSASGNELVKTIGLEVVRGVILDVLTGKNLRDSTEVLTRRRLAALNLAIVNLFLNGSSRSSQFINQLPQLATEILARKKLNKAEKWLAQWVLGLTDKAVQNVLRDNPEALAEYRDRYVQTCQEVINDQSPELGQLQGELRLRSGIKAEVSWLMMLYLLNTVGAQTLAIRGSEKSAYGKLFEKLILGSLLHILGFKYIVPPPKEFERVFWLSSRGERRESDATLLYKVGKGIRFDIGFIGRGNPEISLDKVTRFEREISLGRSRYYLATIILVDRIGSNSRIERLAREVDGTIIQMSTSYWPQQVARELNRILGFKHELIKMKSKQMGDFLFKSLKRVPIEDFIGLENETKA